MPGVFVPVGRRIRRLVDTHQPRMLRVTARHRMIFELAKTTRKGHMFGTAHVLVAQEQHLVHQQQATNLAKQRLVVCSVAQAQANQLSPQRTGQGLNLEGVKRTDSHGNSLAYSVRQAPRAYWLSWILKVLTMTALRSYSAFTDCAS